MTRRTRRAVLAATGAALTGALAGCSQFNPLSGSPSIEYDDSALADLPGTLPQIPPRTPVQPPEEHVVRARDRIRSLLEGVALSQIPNEVVRRRLAQEAEPARDALADDDTPANRVRALAGLTYPRSEAMFVNAGFAAFQASLRPRDIAARRERHRRDADTFLAEYAYVGPAADPVAAFAEHDTLTSWGRAAVRITAADDHHEYDNTVLHVAELAQDVEWGRAYAADARRLHDHYTASLDDPHDYEAHFTSVADTLVDDVATHADKAARDAAPSSVDRNIENTAAKQLLEELAGWRWHGAKTAVQRRDSGQPVAAITQAMRTLTADRALARASVAVANGDYGIPESVEPIAAERAAAVASLRDLLDRSPALLARRLALSAHSSLQNADRRITEGMVSSPGRDLYAEYATANHFATAASAVIPRVSDALDD